MLHDDSDHDSDQQDPPPYRPPYRALDFSQSRSHVARASSFSSSLAALQFTPLDDRTSPTLRTPLSSPPPIPIANSQRPLAQSQRPRSRSQTVPRPRRTLTNTRAPPPRHPHSMTGMSAHSSKPPPYSLTPPELHAIDPTKRASSSPHLRLPTYPSSTSPLYSHSHQAFTHHARTGPTSDEESGAETDEGVVIQPSGASLADTLRNRLLGKGKGRAVHERWSRPITTAPGVQCAGETETEGEDSPRNLPTARITRSSLSQRLTLPPSTAWLVPILFQLFRLLAIFPAVFGTLWNVYRVFRPPDDATAWRIEYSVCVLWSVLTGWQCLQLTTGLLKRWRVYYSPFAALIRLLALQAICWPATHLTLSILDHEARPLSCWAAIGTTTCWSRSIQLWVTSNIVPIPAPTPPGAPAARGGTHTQEEEQLRKGRRRRWDWGQVGVKCALPAGIVYLVMAWALVLRKEFMGC